MKIQDGGNCHAENHCRNSDYFMHQKDITYQLCNSCCYSLYPHEATDVKESFTLSSIWEYKQEHGLRLRPKNGLKILLILAGDIELCPGPAIKCSNCLETIRKNQM